MKKQFTSQTLAIITLIVFALGSLAMPSKAEARWHDQSDQLPGIGGVSTELVVIGVVAVGAAVTYAVIKHGKKAEALTTDSTGTGRIKSQEADSTSQNFQSVTPRTDKETTSVTQKAGKLRPFAGVATRTNDFSEGSGLKLSKVEIKAGIKLNF